MQVFWSHLIRTIPPQESLREREILQASSGAQPAKPATLRFAEELANNVSSSVKDRGHRFGMIWRIYEWIPVKIYGFRN